MQGLFHWFLLLIVLSRQTIKTTSISYIDPSWQNSGILYEDAWPPGNRHCMGALWVPNMSEQSDHRESSQRNRAHYGLCIDQTYLHASKETLIFMHHRVLQHNQCIFWKKIYIHQIRSYTTMITFERWNTTAEIFGHRHDVNVPKLTTNVTITIVFSGIYEHSMKYTTKYISQKSQNQLDKD